MAGSWPSGTVTFLFTDIEGSTRLWQDQPAQMAAALEQHDATLKACVADHGGYIFATGGDGFCVAFQRGTDAADAAIDAQEGAAMTADELIEDCTTLLLELSPAAEEPRAR